MIPRCLVSVRPMIFRLFRLSHACSLVLLAQHNPNDLRGRRAHRAQIALRRFFLLLPVATRTNPRPRVAHCLPLRHSPSKGGKRSGRSSRRTSGAPQDDNEKDLRRPPQEDRLLSFRAQGNGAWESTAFYRSPLLCRFENLSASLPSAGGELPTLPDNVGTFRNRTEGLNYE